MSLSLIASFRGFKNTAPTASEGTYPVPPSLNDLHLPSEALNCPAESVIYLLGWSVRLTPPAIAMRDWPVRILSQARCIA